MFLAGFLINCVQVYQGKDQHIGRGRRNSRRHSVLLAMLMYIRVANHNRCYPQRHSFADFLLSSGLAARYCSTSHLPHQSFECRPRTHTLAPYAHRSFLSTTTAGFRLPIVALFRRVRGHHFLCPPSLTCCLHSVTLIMVIGFSTWFLPSGTEPRLPFPLSLYQCLHLHRHRTSCPRCQIP